jgi:hypothetical protein
MRGTVIAIDPNGRERLVQEVNDSSQDAELLTALQKIVGGYIEAVPHFTTFPFNGGLQRCRAFCNEDGKREQLPYNRFATARWQQALQAQGASLQNSRGELLDFLVGNVAVVFGDAEFMENL